MPVCSRNDESSPSLDQAHPHPGHDCRVVLLHCPLLLHCISQDPKVSSTLFVALLPHPNQILSARVNLEYPKCHRPADLSHDPDRSIHSRDGARELGIRSPTGKPGCGRSHSRSMAILYAMTYFPEIFPHTSPGLKHLPKSGRPSVLDAGEPQAKCSHRCRFCRER